MSTCLHKAYTKKYMSGSGATELKVSTSTYTPTGKTYRPTKCTIIHQNLDEWFPSKTEPQKNFIP